MSILALTTLTLLFGYTRSRTSGSWDESQQQIKKFRGKYDEALKPFYSEHVANGNYHTLILVYLFLLRRLVLVLCILFMNFFAVPGYLIIAIICSFVALNSLFTA